MAIVFELSANFGSDEDAAKRFCVEVKRNYQTLDVMGHQINLHDPLISGFQDYTGQPSFEVSIIPMATGYGVALDQKNQRIHLDASELLELGRKLYDLLRDVDGYQVALVGWDIDWINLAELREDWKEEIITGQFDGLVIAHNVRQHLPQSNHFVSFDDQHDWIPDKGSNTRL